MRPHSNYSNSRLNRVIERHKKFVYSLDLHKSAKFTHSDIINLWFLLFILSDDLHDNQGRLQDDPARNEAKQKFVNFTTGVRSTIAKEGQKLFGRQNFIIFCKKWWLVTNSEIFRKFLQYCSQNLEW